jgi:hypothetical protein
VLYLIVVLKECCILGTVKCHIIVVKNCLKGNIFLNSVVPYFAVCILKFSLVSTDS